MISPKAQCALTGLLQAEECHEGINGRQHAAAKTCCIMGDCTRSTFRNGVRIISGCGAILPSSCYSVRQMNHSETRHGIVARRRTF